VLAQRNTALFGMINNTMHLIA